jgi:hypothetical protein
MSRHRNVRKLNIEEGLISNKSKKHKSQNTEHSLFIELEEDDEDFYDDYEEEKPLSPETCE